jgi:hypothetical protein
VWTLQLNTFGLNGGSALTGVNGLFASPTEVGLGGVLTPGLFTRVDGGLDTHITWGTTGANPISDFWIAADCLQLNTADNGSTLSCDDKVLVGGMNTCVEWKKYECPTFTSAQNGLITSGNFVQMGGTFNQASTTIDGLGTASFSMVNLVAHETQSTIYKLKIGGTYGAPGQVLTVNGVNELTYQNVPVIPPITYTGINGVTVAGTNITLGGVIVDALIEIDFVTTKNFRLKDIQTFELIAKTPKFSSNGSYGVGGEVPIATGGGDWQWGPIVVPPGVITANNGLTAAGNNVQLMGSLIQDTAIHGGGSWFMHFNALTDFRVESTTLEFNINGSTGALNQVLTANGLGKCNWQSPTAGGLILNYVATSANPYVATVADGVIYLLATDQVTELPPVVDNAVLYVVPRTAAVNHQIKPNGAELFWDAAVSYSAATPYTIPVNQPTAFQGVDISGTKFWQIISKA